MREVRKYVLGQEEHKTILALHDFLGLGCYQVGSDIGSESPTMHISHKQLLIREIAWLIGYRTYNDLSLSR